MKLRSGFVSNSSSSSFIVAFPDEIKFSQELKSLLFNNDDGASLYTEEVFSTNDLCDIIYNDYIKGDINGMRKDEWGDLLDEESIISLLTQRYYYCAQNVHIYNLDRFFSDGWAFEPNIYCGSDEKLLNKLEKLHKEEDIESDKYWDIYHSKEVKKYVEENKISIREHPKIRKLYNERLKYQNEIDELEKILAKKDWENFKENHKDFILKYFSYADGDGILYSFLEHGNVFKNLDFLYISQH